jgi:hypothetical protein
MLNQLNQNHSLTLPSQFNQLPSLLKGLVPVENETTQLITYALVATAVVGILVYQYIKSQETND